MANIQVRVDDALRDEAVAVLNRLGMDMATAVRLLLNQIVVDNGYPFKPTSDPFYSSSNIRRERQKFCVHGIIGARQSGASNEHEYQTQFS